MSNRLASETSPYLLQHAHNPVDWFPWGHEAFAKAKADDKPVLVSIGYAACHWCHVMERESFENHEVAALMNDRFVCIKVDREERPDVDAVYMDAVQAIEGQGGWPLNVFVTPEGKPFYGGTYFPPRRAFNRSSWAEVLQAVSKSFAEKRNEIESQAENLTHHLATSNSFGAALGHMVYNRSKIDDAFTAVMKSADKEWGGFGKAPKFPQTFTINILLQYAWYQHRGLSSNKDNRDRGNIVASGTPSPPLPERQPSKAKVGSEARGGEALSQALLSLDKMMQGGLYDHIGGGFARYSTDREWLAPHFEKMLYDNALLVSTLADAYAFTKSEQYRKVIEETLAFIERELMHTDGGFYSALDADSEGVEGKFYVWSHEEATEVLGDDADLFCRFYDITAEGNWEETNIPRVKMPLNEFAKANGMDEDALTKILERGKGRLLARRSTRIRPQLDDKILLSWNALMNTAYTKAYAVTGDPHYREVAENNMQFLLTAFGPDYENLHHTWQAGAPKHPPFLDDYAYLIAGLVEGAQAFSDFAKLDTAAELTEIVLSHYGDDETPFLFYTAQGQQDILLRKKEVYDGATPSANAVMASNLYRLGILMNNPDWRKKAEDAVSAIGELPLKYPTSFGVWLSLLYEMGEGTAEIAIVGEGHQWLLSDLLKEYLPHKLVMASEVERPNYPLLAGKNGGGKTPIFLCKNYACLQPVFTLRELMVSIEAK